MSFRYSYEELCVAAAFLGYPCIYGIPSGNLQTSIRLRERILAVVHRLEEKGLLLVEPGGRICLEAGMYRIVNCMVQAERIGYFAAARPDGCRKTYLYYHDPYAVLQEGDGRGNAVIDIVEEADVLERIVADKLNSGEPTAVAALLSQRRGERFEVALDGAWQGSGEREDRCRAVCDILWKGRG